MKNLEMVTRITEIAYADIDAQYQDEDERAMIKLTIVILLRSFAQDQAPLGNPLFIQALRTIANISEIVMEKK